MIKSEKASSNHHLHKHAVNNYTGAGELAGKRGLRYKARSYIDKKFSNDNFPASYTLSVGRNPRASKHSAVSDDKFAVARFKELNPDMAGNSVRGKNRTGHLGTNFREREILRYNPMAEKAYALSENAGKETGGQDGRSFVAPYKAMRSMMGKGIRIGSHVAKTKELEAVLDVDAAEDKYRVDLQTEKGNINFENIKIK